ncbi:MULTISPECIES: M4 family metallopeptidase [unclassified Kitasatospora]|uniref:M4 family metallopeptidase n=1 Tax=unclassified Kitasatospora TaxID=2633591 RepID=UPI002474D30B|nr:M4 family metallopeptidase [Kitasatospora sp. MAP12-44]
MPDLALETTRDQKRTGTTLVRFHQTHGDIPVFGAEALVELDGERQLVSIACQLGDVEDVSSVPTLKSTEALSNVSQAIGVELDPEFVPPASLALFQASNEDWHLVWHLREVPGRVPEAQRGAEERGHGLAPSPREDSPLTGYLVDAHDGEILFYYGMAPTAVAVPTKLDGIDEDGINRIFWGQVKDKSFYFNDVSRHIRTFDLNGADIETCQLPVDTVSSVSPVLGGGFKGPVTAHSKALQVYEFYRNVLQRDGIDDAGMDLMSLVSCTYRSSNSEWCNAVWWHGRMWFGQTRDGNGVMVSMARYLDVIAHELTHGVIETSSNLIYRDEAGALNESFSDIFGVIIRNWYLADRNDVTTWSWEVGSGLGQGGLPLRDLSDPNRTGDPAHMRDYAYTMSDDGGVHTNSNIHNKVAYNLLTSTGQLKEPVLEVEDWAVLLYLAMVRLPSLASFADAQRELHDVTNTFLAGRPSVQAAVHAAIDDAYGRVGI